MHFVSCAIIYFKNGGNIFWSTAPSLMFSIALYVGHVCHGQQRIPANEQESKIASQNGQLGVFELVGIAPAPCAVPQPV